MIIDKTINMLDTLYPTTASKISNGWFTTDGCSTTYGYVLSGVVVFPNGNIAIKGQYFSYWSLSSQSLSVDGEAVCICRLGFKGQNNIGGPLEKSGRLCYIDTCSDSLLIYPPRQGDPSLNALYFPTQTEQSFHIHPSIRIGVVASGTGFSCLKDKEIRLNTGDMFCIEEREVHRFRTLDTEMVVVAFHPDGDWGPTDHNHTMLNRTYITK